jgi:hypothetical protein
MKARTAKTPISNLSSQLATLIRSFPLGVGFNDWHAIPEVRQAYELMAKEKVIELPDIAKPKCSGRGIVIPGGGIKYFPSMWVGINRIRQLGCVLPIEVWYLGEVELDATMMRLLQPLNVTFRDAHEYRKRHPMRILNGWELKPYAITHSDFQEVMFIDADCTPVRNPTFLFEAEPYRRTGTVFWPDYPHWMLQPDVYDIFGAPKPRCTKIPGDDYQVFGLAIDQSVGWDVPVESGQMLIDKSRCWEQLQLALHFCEHSDFYFRFVHGDKEAFHLAWRRLGKDYGMPQRWPHWDLHTALQYDFKGEVLFAHRNNDKWKLAGNSMGTGRIPFEREMFDLVKELSKLWNGVVWENTKPTEAEQEVMDQLSNKTFFYHRINRDARLIELLPNGQIGKGRADHETTWSVFIVDGKKRLSLSSKTSPTCFLYPGKSGRWSGNWLINERMPVEMIPAEVQ